MFTINTLWYTLLWAFMLIVGGLMYEQPHFVRKKKEKYKTLELIGWCIVIGAMIGFIHYGILGTLHWIIT